MATDQPIGNGGWVGLGASPPTAFVTNTVTIPVSAIVIGLVLNIRNNIIANNETVTATLFTSPCGFAAPTNRGISAVITGPNNSNASNCSAAGFGNVPVNQGELLSVQITTSSGVGMLNQGVTVALYLQLP